MRNYDADMAAELAKEILQFYFLFEFQFTATYRYTDRDVSIFVNGNRYYPVPIRFNSISLSGALSVDSVLIDIGNADRVMSGILLNEDCRNKPVIISFGIRKCVDVASVYPPAHSDTYVKATSTISTSYWPYYATDPTKSLIGVSTPNSWGGNATNQQRFHIDLGSAQIIKRIYYENYHGTGDYINIGIKNFTLWGSNDADSFADLDYSHDTGWTQIDTSQSYFEQHIAANTPDPHYITMPNNSTPYRYYALKIADNYGNGSYMGIRRVELQAGGDEDIVETLFLGIVAGWPVLNEKKVTIKVANEFILWNKKTLRKHAPSCPWTFKGEECGYAGTGKSVCDKSYDTCLLLGNESRFGGFRFIPVIAEKELWWGQTRG